MADLTCLAVVLPAEAGDTERAAASVRAAWEQGGGDFAAISWEEFAGNERVALAAAAQKAARDGTDWLLAITAGEAVVPHLFIKAAPALRIHDAVWGAAALVSDAAAAPKPEQVTRLAAQDEAMLFHAALRWWIGRSHFVRPSAALAALDAASGPGWYAEYLVALWRNCRAYKTAQPLTLFRGAIPPLAGADRERLLQALQDDPVFMTVTYGPRTFELPYTGLNPVIEREQARGFFFEHDELHFLAQRLPRGLQVVDAGANTGNHTVFFAGALEASRVLPIEPDPRACRAIGVAAERNRLERIDLSKLGRAVGAGTGRLRAVYSEGGGLGATRFVADPEGDVECATLDALVAGPVDFLKVDVEGMEMAVLAGAENLIQQSRPAIYIEVLDGSVGPFLQWVDARGYRLEKLFPDKAHCNYFLLPSERS